MFDLVPWMGNVTQWMIYAGIGSVALAVAFGGGWLIRFWWTGR